MMSDEAKAETAGTAPAAGQIVTNPLSNFQALCRMFGPTHAQLLANPDSPLAIGCLPEPEHEPPVAEKKRVTKKAIKKMRPKNVAGDRNTMPPHALRKRDVEEILRAADYHGPLPPPSGFDRTGGEPYWLRHHVEGTIRAGLASRH